MNVLIVGYGDIGRRVARLWLARGAAVRGLFRAAGRADAVAAEGVVPLPADLDDPASLSGLPGQDALIYYLAPPPASGTKDPRMAAFTTALTASGLPARVVYVSTAGVYGDRGGDWAREEDTPNPQTDRARRRLDAETTLRAWGRQHDVPVVILRLGGIYGDGRLPRARLEKGLPVLREAECGYTNRIHADDLAAVCLAAAERGRPDTVYNVSDGRPGTMTEYFKAVADALGLPRPPEIGMAEARDRLTPQMISYLTESRRLDTARMREELGVELRYPDLAAGLRQARG